jgi:hypothetical protein
MSVQKKDKKNQTTSKRKKGGEYGKERVFEKGY